MDEELQEPASDPGERAVFMGRMRRSRIKTAVEASDLAHAQGYLELESQLREFMAEVEEKRTNAEAVILDLVKELVRTAQEVESMNAQGALVEEPFCFAPVVSAWMPWRDLESNWPSKGSDAQEPHVLEDAEEDDTLPFAPLSRSTAVGAVRASHTLGLSRPSEQMRSRRDAFLHFECGPLPKAAAKTPAATLGAQKLVEAAAAKAAAEALEKAKASLSELREELRSDLAATVAAEKEKAVESFAALEKALTAQVESTVSELTALAGPRPRLPIDPREREGSQDRRRDGGLESQVQGGPDAAGLTPRVAEPSQGDIDSPKAWTAKKPRTSFRVLGALGSAMTKSLDSTFLEVDQRIVEEISCYRNDQRDKDEILSIVEKHGWALRYAPPLFKYSEEICVAAVKSYPLVLEFISPDMRENEKVVKQAVSQCGMALLFATAKMRNRKDVVMKAVQNCGLALEFAHPDRLHFGLWGVQA
eukprot:s831_g6.t1